MLNQMRIKNFKCFENINLNFNKVNLLLGTNSGGKSSLIQSILISKIAMDNLKKGKNSIDLISNMYNLDMHSFNEILFLESYEDEINIDIEYNEHKKRLSFFQTEDPNILTVKVDCVIEDFMSDLIYLGSDRSISRLQKRGDHSDIVLGEDNKYLAYILDRAQKNLVKFYPERNHWEDKNNKLLDLQINYWLNYILPQNRVTSKQSATDNYISLLFGEKSTFHQMNIGYGVSFVLPIIVAGLIASPNSIFIIENPELHLHPKAQSSVALFLAMVAASGVQVIIETHSEHIVNGFRKAILNENILLEKENLKINFFNVETKCSIQEIEINEMAEIKSWPKGFLDQEEEDLFEIRKLRLKL